MNILIREYKEEDLDDVNNVLTEAFSVRKTNFKKEEFHEVVAVIDNCICGYLLMTKVLNPVLNKYYYLIDYVAVSKKYQGNGIGTKLVEYAENLARDEETIYLQLTCGYHRKAAHILYEKCGFIKRESDIFRKGLV